MESRVAKWTISSLSYKSISLGPIKEPRESIFELGKLPYKDCFLSLSLRIVLRVK